MRVRAVLLAGVTAALIVACSPPASQAPGQNADADAGAAQNAPIGVNQMVPGQYRTTITMQDMAMPGVPAGVMAQMHPGPISTEHCVTATDIADFTTRDMNNGPNGMTCTAVRTNSSGGHIDNEATCTGPMGTMNMHMVGAYTPTRVEMDMTTTGQMQGHDITQQSHMVTERIGDCPAGNAAAP